MLFIILFPYIVQFLSIVSLIPGLGIPLPDFSPLLNSAQVNFVEEKHWLLIDRLWKSHIMNR